MRAAEFASSLCSTVGKHNGESSGISRPVSSRAGCTDSVLKLSEWRLRNMETLKKNRKSDNAELVLADSGRGGCCDCPARNPISLKVRIHLYVYRGGRRKYRNTRLSCIIQA